MMVFNLLQTHIIHMKQCCILSGVPYEPEPKIFSFKSTPRRIS